MIAFDEVKKQIIISDIRGERGGNRKERGSYYEMKGNYHIRKERGGGGRLRKTKLEIQERV